jgi:hypothetical protein
MRLAVRASYLAGLLLPHLGACLAPAPSSGTAVYAEEPRCPEEVEAQLAAAAMWRQPEPTPVPGVIAALPPSGSSEPLEPVLPEPPGSEGSRAAEASRANVLVETRTGHGLLAIDPQDKPFRALVPPRYVSCGELVSTLRICVSEAGAVSDMQILRPSLPIVDVQLAQVIPRWRYRPYFLQGRATPFCYVLRYRVRPTNTATD